MGSVAYVAHRIVNSVLIVADNGSLEETVQRAMGLTHVYAKTLIQEAGRLSTAPCTVPFKVDASTMLDWASIFSEYISYMKRQVVGAMLASAIQFSEHVAQYSNHDHRERQGI